jgi:membrane-bound serine protease (ClpP class)
MQKRFSIIGWVIFAFFLVGTSFSKPLSSLSVKPVKRKRPLVLVMKLKGAISAASASYIERGVAAGEKEKAELVVLELDTPGGAGQAMLDIVQTFDNSHVPICVFVYPRGAMAASAGMYITEAAQIAAMAPETTIGAAHPVTASGGNIQSDLKKKITNTFAAIAATHARRYGRNVKWVEEAVRKSVSATVGEAVKLKIVDLEADNLKDLLGKINGRKVKVLNHTIILKTKNALVKKAPMTSVERFLMTITNPEVVLILFMLGSYGLLFELLSPGGVLPGVVGAICLILAFYAMGTLSVNYAGVFLIVLSFVLFLLDLKLQAHGTLTIGGIVSLIMGSLLLFESNITYTAGYLSAVAASVFLTLVFFLVAVKKVWEAARLKPNTGREGIVGKIGVVKTALNPQGYIALDGTYWKAVVDNGPVNEGEKVSVVKVENLILYVKKVEAN